MDWQHALAASQTIGFAFAFAARYLPESLIKNKVVPKIGFVSIWVTNLALLWNTFLKSAELTTAHLLGPMSEHGVYMAGFASVLGIVFKPLLVIAQPTLLSFGQYWLNRVFHEGGVKPVAKGT